MKQPPVSPELIPILSDTVPAGAALQPVHMPWQIAQNLPDLSLGSESQDDLAQKVLDRVQQRLAALLPEMLRDAVDQVLNEERMFGGLGAQGADSSQANKR